MVSVQASRFALLKLDDDSDSADVKGNQSNAKSQAAAKKKNKKKRKDNQETDELRNLAFGKTKGKSHANGNLKTGKGDATEAQWEQWKKKDEGYAADNFEKDLQDALLMSKIEHEEQSQMRKEFEAAGIVLTENGKPKKKKTKTKGTMSLDEFQKSDKRDVPKTKRNDDSSEEEESTPASLPPLTHVSEPDPTFFDNVDKDVHKILQKEKIQEQYKKNFAVESVRSQQFQDTLEKKDREIAMLKDSHEKLAKELKQVKKRNQQLCHILAQGEMKDKTKILLELDGLREVRDELTEEVTSLTSELEKERSKVHALQGEGNKQKGGKHK